MFTQKDNLSAGVSRHISDRGTMGDGGDEPNTVNTVIEMWVTA